MIVFLRRSGSPFADSLARVAGDELSVLELEAPQASAPVSVIDQRVLWQGVELTCARAVLVEELAFAWPQRLSSAGNGAQDDRPRRSLALSALAATAESVPMVDPPELGHLAALPLFALAVLQEHGVPVQPHRLAPARPPEDARASPPRIWLDVAGPVRGYVPHAPAAGEPAWSPEPFAGPVLSVLVVGAHAVGALVSADAPAWEAGRSDGAIPAAELEPALCTLAESAARALGCHAAEVALVRDAGTVLCASPGPAWSRFEAALGASVPRALWEHALTLEPR